MKYKQRDNKNIEVLVVYNLKYFFLQYITLLIEISHCYLSISNFKICILFKKYPE